MSETICPGCGARLPKTEWPEPQGYHASRECFKRLGELTSYTQSLRDPAFPHQYAVDTYAAQHPSPEAPPIKLAFALAGLLLACERGFTGREVQLAHMKMARKKRDWPRFATPAGRAPIQVAQVAADPARLREWMESVWKTWAPEHERVRALVAEFM